MEGTIHIGCSGYYYSYWKNRFYPSDVPASSWLQYYSMIFDTVELNGTFYKTPMATTLERYAQQTPDDFTFAVKVSKYITHILRLKDAAESINAFQNLVRLGLKDKLRCFLFQLPPSFQYTTENLDRVLASIPSGFSNVVEFRHRSWWNETVREKFIEHSLTFCNVDFPGLDTPILTTSPLFYFRFHGNPVLFKSSYTVMALEEFVERFPKDAKHYHLYFNNTYYEAGYTNAAEMMERAGNLGSLS